MVAKKTTSQQRKPQEQSATPEQLKAAVQLALASHGPAFRELAKQ